MSNTDPVVQSAIQLRIVAAEVTRILTNMKAMIAIHPSINSPENQRMIQSLEEKLAQTHQALAHWEKNNRPT